MQVLNQLKTMKEKMLRRVLVFGIACQAFSLLFAEIAIAQLVCLPAPRLMTTLPMGAQRGTTTEVKITGQNSEQIKELIFSHPAITSKPVTDTAGNPVPDKFLVTIKPDCPIGIHDARIVTRLGVSAARAFSVCELPEVTRQTANTSLDQAMNLEVSCISNAFTTRQAIDYYRFAAKKGERIYVECAASGIDSKLKPVLIVGDSDGADLMVERRGGALDFLVPEDGEYTVKVHDLTYNGGTEYFYRLSLRKAKVGEVVALHPTTRNVNAFSWPPVGYDDKGTIPEIEQKDQPARAQVVSLPCQISGSFFPAADVDAFEFVAKKGETWWIEVASDRLGRPTDPAIVVQQVSEENGKEKVVDIAELSDILSPVKVSSNGYSYDGPPYNAGSSDIIGSFTTKQDGKHRIQITDLFGGTRNDARNRYQMIIRKAQPDFAIVSWALHMNLRNGDRNALSKPLALRRGAAMILEVVAVRRDGFNGPIELKADNLPPGVTAEGISIPQGQSRGYFVINADSKAPVGHSMIHLSGTGTIDGKSVTRKCHWASMRWPVANAWSEIPNPRLMANTPVSVSDSEFAPLSLVANEDKVWEVEQGKTLTIPLVHTKRCDFSGPSITLKTLSESLSRNPAFDAALSAEITQAKVDLSKVKVSPGEYTIAFYGSAVAKYQYNPESVAQAEAELQNAKKELSTLEPNSKRLATLKSQVTAAEKKLATAKAQSKPKDIVDIIVSKPIKIKVVPPKKDAKP